MPRCQMSPCCAISTRAKVQAVARCARRAHKLSGATNCHLLVAGTRDYQTIAVVAHRCGWVVDWAAVRARARASPRGSLLTGASALATEQSEEGSCSDRQGQRA